MTKSKHKACYECGEPIENRMNRKYCKECSYTVKRRQQKESYSRKKRRNRKMTYEDHSEELDDIYRRRKKEGGWNKIFKKFKGRRTKEEMEEVYRLAAEGC